MICLANFTFQLRHKQQFETFTISDVVCTKLDKSLQEQNNFVIARVLKGQPVASVLSKLVINEKTQLPKLINIFYYKEISESFQTIAQIKKSIFEDSRNYFAELCATTRNNVTDEKRPEKCLVWTKLFDQEKAKPYMKELQTKIRACRATGKVYPEQEDVFRAFKLTHYDEVKVVVFGQDPYHTAVADGLAFSSKGSAIPPSLVNIFKEVKNNLPESDFKSADLTPWAEQGILLLNTCLTVNEGKAGSHAEYGWLTYIRAVIDELNKKKSPVIFCLWGKYAQSLAQYIHSHHVKLLAGHPSPLNSKNDFIGCKHFTIINQYLSNPINFNTYE